MKRLLIVCLSVLCIVSACPAPDVFGYVDKKALFDELRSLGELLSQIQSTQGPICTPVELAQAQTYLTQAIREFDEGDYWEAEDKLVLARTTSQRMLKLIPGCLNDLDQDRIPDRKDRCRDAPENYNGYIDDDGCPDQAPKRAVLTPDRIELLEPIQFSKDGNQITPDSEPVLTDVARILVENPGLRLDIEAHTDDHSSPQEAKKRTQEWAMAVKAWLQARGIQADRLEAQGKGSSEPIAPNATPLGREMNQRIEFIRLPAR